MSIEEVSAIPINTNHAVTPHSRTAKVLHWGFILVLVYGLAKQLDDVEELEDVSLLQNELLFAAVFLVLLLARFAYMRLTRPTALPSSAPERTKRWAYAVHLSMYASLALIAISGLYIGVLYWAGTKAGLAMDIGLLVHEVAVNASYFLIAGHIAAAVWHRHQGDGLWDAMVPLWKEPHER